MRDLDGRVHHQSYHAHFIPVLSVRPNQPNCMTYYPCAAGQTAAWDELAVFDPAQTLPRFWVEVAPAMVGAPSTTAECKPLLARLAKLLTMPAVKSHMELKSLLTTRYRALRSLPGGWDAGWQQFALEVELLLDEDSGQLNDFIVEELLVTYPFSQGSESGSPTQATLPAPQPTVPVATTASVTASLAPVPPTTNLIKAVEQGLSLIHI